MMIFNDSWLFTTIGAAIGGFIFRWLWNDRFLTAKLWVMYFCWWPIIVIILVSFFVFLVGIQPKMKLTQDGLFQFVLSKLKAGNQAEAMKFGFSQLESILRQTTKYRQWIDSLKTVSDQELPLEKWFPYFKAKLGYFLNELPAEVSHDINWMWKSPQLSLIRFKEDKRGVIFSWRLEKKMSENYLGVYVVNNVPTTLTEFMSDLGDVPWPEKVTRGLFEFLKSCGSDEVTYPRITSGSGNSELYMRCYQGDVRKIDFGETIANIPLRTHIERSLQLLVTDHPSN